MPGIFDPQNGGLLGGIFGAMAGSSPGGQDVQFRRQGYNELAQELGPGQAALALGSPEAFNAAWQRQLFMGQLQDYQRRNPNMGLPEILYKMSAEGQKQQYGITPVPGFKTPSGAEAPGTIQAGGIQPPPGMGFNNPQPVGQATAPQSSPAGTQPQASPGMGGSSGPSLSPMDQRGIAYKSRLAAEEETARKQADAQQQYPNALVTSQDAIKRLEAFRDNPDLPKIVGGPGGLFGRTAAIGQGQADLVNESNELQGKIIANALNASRSVSGRPVTPGALKELTVGAGDLIAGRKGTLEGYKSTINNSIDLIKKETQAAWEATGKQGTQPSWGAPNSATAQQYPEGTVAHNKTTGETRVMRAGRWQ